MTWTNLTFNFGAVLTSTQMTQLDDNFEAQAAGDSGAPTQAIAGGGTGATTAANARTNLGLGDLSVEDIVVRSLISTATNVSQAGTLNNGSPVDITLDAYSFFPMIHVDLQGGNGVCHMSGHSTDGASADAPRFQLENTGGGDPATYDVDYRYIAAT